MEQFAYTTFGFDFTSYEETAKEVNNLKTRTVSHKTNISFKIVKENIDIIYFLYHNYNSLSCSTFSPGMKYAKVTYS